MSDATTKTQFTSEEIDGFLEALDNSRKVIRQFEIFNVAVGLDGQISILSLIRRCHDEKKKLVEAANAAKAKAEADKTPEV